MALGIYRPGSRGTGQWAPLISAGLSGTISVRWAGGSRARVSRAWKDSVVSASAWRLSPWDPSIFSWGEAGSLERVLGDNWKNAESGVRCGQGRCGEALLGALGPRDGSLLYALRPPRPSGVRVWGCWFHFKSLRG